MRVPTLSPRAYRRLTLVNVALLMAIVVSGAAVRLSGSGLGCDEWPNCNADSFVHVGDTHSAVEQLNRIFSGLIGLPILLALVFAYTRRPRRRDLVVLSWLMLVTFLGNAVLGGVSVLVKLAWVSVMGHFLLAIALIGLALTAHKRAGEPTAGPYRPTVSPRALAVVRAVYALTVWVLVIGTLVTAAGPHGGDEDARRLSWQIRDVARVHSVSVDILVVLVIALVVLLARERAPRPVMRATSFALAAMVAQGILGYVQYAEAIPALLVGFHVAGAVLVFTGVHWLLLATREPLPVAESGGPERTPRDAQPALAG